MANPNQYYDVLVRPVVTEKSTLHQASGQYTFEVAPQANKVEIRKAVETLFKVKVTSVNIVRLPGKIKRSFGRPGMTRPWKKAVITLRKGDNIEIA
ncbi:MAG: 50S ribosomal protein L23 [Planctomycetes bacterium]|nr:50S ribosomal protein L23 [Planctomycetota bacterium]